MREEKGGEKCQTLRGNASKSSLLRGRHKQAEGNGGGKKAKWGGDRKNVGGNPVNKLS